MAFACRLFSFFSPGSYAGLVKDTVDGMRTLLALCTLVGVGCVICAGIDNESDTRVVDGFGLAFFLTTPFFLSRTLSLSPSPPTFLPLGGAIGF